MRILLIFLIAISFISVPPDSYAQTSRYFCENGEVSFISEAPLETIKASSGSLKGILDTSSREFAFTIDIVSFIGFNSPLQRTHFQENYMETSRYSSGTFKGRLIEQVDLNDPGTFNVRAKGKMSIHGNTQEVIIPCLLISDGTSVQASAEFLVRLSDYDISIPKVVGKKISEDISVKVNVAFLKK